MTSQAISTHAGVSYPLTSENSFAFGSDLSSAEECRSVYWAYYCHVSLEMASSNVVSTSRDLQAMDFIRCVSPFNDQGKLQKRLFYTWKALPSSGQLVNFAQISTRCQTDRI